MSQVSDMLQLLSENWFLQEPAFFGLYCQQQLTENVRMDCAFRCGQGRIEYNPLLLSHKNYAEVEQLLRIEMIRLFLKHPYERQPEGCCREAMTEGSNVTIADGYCMLHHEKLPLHDPAFYHLPLGQYYEWYAKALQSQSDDNRERSDRSQQSSPVTSSTDGGGSQQSSGSSQPADDSSQSHNPDDSLSSKGNADQSALWQEDSIQRQRINDLIERTTDWGTLPADVVERIKASTKARIDNRLIWQGFHSAVISSQRHLTRMRPNRRTGFVQMGSTRQFDTRLLVAIDVSGSVSNEMLSDFFSSVNRLFRYGIAQIDVCQFDAEMGPVEPMKRAANEVKVVGRGGTSYQPVFDFIEENKHRYDGLIILTDGQAPPPALKQRPGAKARAAVPVLWVCHNRAAYEAYHEWMKLSGRCCYL